MGAVDYFMLLGILVFFWFKKRNKLKLNNNDFVVKRTRDITCTSRDERLNSKCSLKFTLLDLFPRLAPHSIRSIPSKPIILNLSPLESLKISPFLLLPINISSLYNFIYLCLCTTSLLLNMRAQLLDGKNIRDSYT